jgi:plasmid maintenance system antidote protein VapI
MEMAYRISKAFGSTPAQWLMMQPAYDFAHGKVQREKLQ